MSRVALLSGGVGGAKLALGLYRHLEPGALSVIVNTADDFEHLGLAISPDIDTVIYTLAGLANPVMGWGRRDEQWACMAALEELGGDTWFRLGDRDLAMHLVRTSALAAGESLTQVTADIARRLHIAATILPMTNQRVRTKVLTAEGPLGFQEYFVKARCEPRVRAIEFVHGESVCPTPEIAALLTADSLDAIILAPSNPFLSLDPILSVPGVRDALKASRAPVIAVSPLIGVNAFKGPTAKIMAELGLPLGTYEVAARYADIVDGYVVDSSDRDAVDAIESLDISVRATAITMSDLASKIDLAKETLALAGVYQAGRDAC